VRYYDEFKLICDPFFDRLPRKQQARVSSKLSYDLVYLGRRKQGTWTFQLSLEGSDDRMDLVLQQSYQRRRELPSQAKRTLRLPLYFDGNSSTIHVGYRNKAIDELDLGLPPQPNDLGEVDIDVSSDESDQDSDVESAMESAPETASRITEAGTATTGSSTGEDEMFTSSMFSVTDSWAFQGGEQPDPNAEIHVHQVEVSPIFDGLPAPRKTRSGGGKASTPFSHRVEPYGQAWARRAQNGFLS
jgi:hypothetical protein